MKPSVFGGDKDPPAVTTFPRLKPGSAIRSRSRCTARIGGNWRVVAVDVVDNDQHGAVVVIIGP